MSEKRPKRKRQHRAAAGSMIPPRASASHPHDEMQSFHVLPTALSAAVPLYILELYERGGPEPEAFSAASAFGAVLAERGDRLLFRSELPGETAELFNRLARTLAVLAFLPDGITLFGEHFDAAVLLTAVIGPAAAQEYCRQVVERLTHDP